MRWAKPDFLVYQMMRTEVSSLIPRYGATLIEYRYISKDFVGIAGKQIWVNAVTILILYANLMWGSTIWTIGPMELTSEQRTPPRTQVEQSSSVAEVLLPSI
jgi:hypothetical protein